MWLRKTPRKNYVYGKPTVLYRAWQNMRGRCNGRNHDGRQNYRWIGVGIAEEFQDYPKFREWAISNGFSPKNRSIDRIDSDGEYSPANCQWLTKANHCRKSVSKRWANKYRCPQPK